MTDPQDWRSRKRAATARRIYDTAMKLFLERGYDAVNVGDITAGAGVSVPTFYAHYRSREYLVLPAYAEETVAAALLRQPCHLPLSERLRLALHDLAGQTGPADRPDLLARWQLVLRTPVLRARSAEREHDITAALLAALQPGPDDTSRTAVRDAVVVAAYLSAATRAAMGWAAANGESTLEEMLDAAFQALRDI